MLIFNVVLWRALSVSTKKMKIKELIGKKIKEIKMEIRDFNYNGSIPIAESNSIIILETGEIFKIPYNNSIDVEICSNITKNQKSIFSKRSNLSLLNRILEFISSAQQLKNKITKNIKGKEIISVYQYENGFSEINREWDKCLLEIESGYIISEKSLSPKGSGQAGIWIFSSKDDLLKKIGGGFQIIK